MSNLELWAEERPTVLLNGSSPDFECDQNTKLASIPLELDPDKEYVLQIER